MKISAVEESNEGLYIWETDDGKWFMDEEGNVLNVPATKGDTVKIEALKKVAHGLLRDMGMEPQGRPRFLSGHRRVTDEQYEEQKARQAAGLTPDPFDVGAMMDDLREAKQDGGRIR